MDRSPHLLPLLLVLGCASSGPVMVNGVARERVTADFTGTPYTVRLSKGHPAPGEPSSGVVGAGGMLSGMVCGVSLDYEVEHKGQYLEAVGQLDNSPALSSALRMAGDAEIHVIKGSLASRAIDLKITRDAITGFVGRRSVSYHRVGGDLENVFTVTNVRSAEIHQRMKDVDALWRLPPAVQLVMVPMLIACQFSRFEDTSMPLDDPPAVVFGGPTGAVPPGTLVFR